MTAITDVNFSTFRRDGSKWALLCRMRTLACLFLYGLLIQTPLAKEFAIDEAFIVSLPPDVKERPLSERPDNAPDSIRQKFRTDSFHLSIYRWSDIKPHTPLKQIPKQWAQSREWATISAISEGKTDSGIPYIRFHTRINQDNRRPFDSVMTVLRSSTGKAFMFQMWGDPKVINATIQSIRFVN